MKHKLRIVALFYIVMTAIPTLLSLLHVGSSSWQLLNLIWFTYPFWLLKYGQLDKVVEGYARSPRLLRRMLWTWWMFGAVAIVAFWVVASLQSWSWIIANRAVILSNGIAQDFQTLERHLDEVLAGAPAGRYCGVNFVVGQQVADSNDRVPLGWINDAEGDVLGDTPAGGRYHLIFPKADYTPEGLTLDDTSWGGYLVEAAGGRAVAMSLTDVYGRWLPTELRPDETERQRLAKAAGFTEKGDAPSNPPTAVDPRMGHWDVVYVRRVHVSPHASDRGFLQPVEMDWLGQAFMPQAGRATPTRPQMAQFLAPLVFLSPQGVVLDQVEVLAQDNRSLAGAFKQWAWVLLTGAGLLMGFAVSIEMAGRGVQQQAELTEARTNFTNMVSHELRTPLASLRLHTDLLENHLVTEVADVEACYHELGEQLRRLQHLVETVMELARTERGARRFEVQPESLNQVVHEALERLGDERPADLSVHLQEDLPPALLDREAAIQIVVNLCQNAIRYAKEVSVTTRSDSQGVVLEVADRGPGIPRQKRARIFEPYVRGQAEGRGLGLGLALVQGYTQGQQGTISLEDRPGGGCLFSVRFRR